MYGGELEEKLHETVGTEGFRYAVLGADQLVEVVHQSPEALVVNTDPVGTKGTHWVSFYLPAVGPAEFFDSMGQPPETYNPDFRNFLVVKGPPYLFNTLRLQSDDSDLCGEYCMYFLLLRTRGISFQMFLDQFRGGTPEQNDSHMEMQLLREYNNFF